MNSPHAKASVRSGRLAASRAFVVQLDEDTTTRLSEPVRGRIEHIATGEQCLFDSLGALESFMRRSFGDDN